MLIKENPGVGLNARVRIRGALTSVNRNDVLRCHPLIKVRKRPNYRDDSGEAARNPAGPHLCFGSLAHKRFLAGVKKASSLDRLTHLGDFVLDESAFNVDRSAHYVVQVS